MARREDSPSVAAGVRRIGVSTAPIKWLLGDQAPVGCTRLDVEEVVFLRLLTGGDVIGEEAKVDRR